MVDIRSIVSEKDFLQMAPRTLDAETARDVVGMSTGDTLDGTDFDFLDSVTTRQTRWGWETLAVLRDVQDGSTWGFVYELGSGDSDYSSFDDFDLIELLPVEPRMVSSWAFV